MATKYCNGHGILISLSARVPDKFLFPPPSLVQGQFNLPDLSLVGAHSGLTIGGFWFLLKGKGFSHLAKGWVS